MSEYTNEELLAAIRAALKAQDMIAVAALVRVLAVQSPVDAQIVLDAVALTKAANR